MENKGLIFAVVAGAFIAGNVTGFCAGVASIEEGKELLAGAFESEQPADLATPTVIARPGFRVSHPGNWRLDTRDPDHDPDHKFSIDSPGSTFVMFAILGAHTDPAEANATQVVQFKKLMSGAVETSFTRWGRYEGSGVELRGRVFGMAARVRLFVHATETRTVMITSQAFDDDLKMVAPGLALIESSFELLGS